MFSKKCASPLGIWAFCRPLPFQGLLSSISILSGRSLHPVKIWEVLLKTYIRTSP